MIIIRECCFFLEAPEGGLQVSGQTLNNFFVGLHLLNNEMLSRERRVSEDFQIVFVRNLGITEPREKNDYAIKASAPPGRGSVLLSCMYPWMQSEGNMYFSRM